MKFIVPGQNLEEWFSQIGQQHEFASSIEYIGSNFESWTLSEGIPNNGWRELGHRGCLYHRRSAAGRTETAELINYFSFGYRMARLGFRSLGVSVINEVVGPVFCDPSDSAFDVKFWDSVSKGSTIIGLAMAETESGSNLSEMKTTYSRKTDGEFIIRGRKNYVSNGWYCTHVLLLAQAEGSNRINSLKWFWIDVSTPGVRKSRRLGKIGMPARDISEIEFEDVTLKPSSLAFNERSNLLSLINLLKLERLSAAVHLVGICQSVFENLVRFSDLKTVRSQSLSTDSLFQSRIGAVAARALAAENYLLSILKSISSTGEIFSMDLAAFSVAKQVALSAALELVAITSRTVGGEGYFSNSAFARFETEVRGLMVYAGSSDLLDRTIGEAVISQV